MGRLLDAHLEGVISREEYVGRKEKLLLEKSALSARIAEVGVSRIIARTSALQGERVQFGGRLDTSSGKGHDDEPRLN